MFEHFSDAARRAVVLAYEEARKLSHSNVGPEHILFGLISEEGGIAREALTSLGITAEATRERLNQRNISDREQTPVHPVLTNSAKKALMLSLQEAHQLSHRNIGTADILLALTREQEGVAAELLVSLGGDLDRIPQHVIEQLQGREEERAPLRERTEVRVHTSRSKGSKVYPARDMRSVTTANPLVKEDKEEIEELRREIARLRVLLRQHGVDPSVGDDGAASDPVG